MKTIRDVIVCAFVIICLLATALVIGYAIGNSIPIDLKSA
jgi:hypothetical protein